MEPASAILRVPIWPNGVPGAVGNTEKDNPCLTLYLAQAAPTSACIIILPGGSYVGHAAHESEPVARWLNSIGVSAAVLNYRVTPYRHPFPMYDAQRAVRTVRYHAVDWGIDPQRIGVLGFSAGGHLAATVGAHYDAGVPTAADPVERLGCRPDLLVLCYPVISFITHRHEGSMHHLLGDDPAKSDMILLSNELQVTPDTPPTFLWHTASDAGVPVENSMMFATALSKNKVPFAMHIYPAGRHGLGMAAADPYVASWLDECAKFLTHCGFRPSE